MMTIIEVLQYVLLLSKTKRTKLSKIRTESNLTSFLDDIGLEYDDDTLDSFKAVVPTLYKLQDYINEIDNEINIVSVFTDNYGTLLKQCRNVPNFTRVMLNFDSASLFVRFGKGKNKFLAIRLNENWMSPKRETKLQPNLYKTLLKFDDFISKIKDYRQTKVQEFRKSTKELDDDRDFDNLVSFDGFNYESNEEQAYEIFECLYRFNPTKSNNDGLYTIILECDSKFFGTTNKLVHELDTIECFLNKLNILKSNPTPNIKLIYNKFERNTFWFDFLIENQLIETVKLLLRNNKLTIVG